MERAGNEVNALPNCGPSESVQFHDRRARLFGQSAQRSQRGYARCQDKKLFVFVDYVLGRL